MRLPSASALFAAAAVSLVLGALALQGQRAIVQEDAFVAHAARTLAQDEVREEAAARIDARLVSARPELARAEGMLERATIEAVEAPGFVAAFRAGAARLHQALFAESEADVALSVPGAAAMVADRLDPRVGARVRRAGDEPLLSLGGNARERALRRLGPIARRLTGAAPVLLALGLVLLAAGVARRRNLRRGLFGAAVAVGLAGGLLAAGVRGARNFVLDHFDTAYGDAVVSTIWGEFVGDLRIWGLVAAAAGVAVAGAASRGLAADADALRARLARRRPTLWALALIAAAAGFLLLPTVVGPFAVVAVAGVLLYAGAAELATQYRTAAR
jgi:hypothetical protein